MQAQSIQWLMKAANTGGAPKATLDLVKMRVRQINGFSSDCVEEASYTGEMVAAWRETSYFDAAERAALALAEAAIELTDSTDPVPADVWDAAAKHYDEKGLAALVLTIATSNMMNRINETTRQLARAFT